MTEKQILEKKQYGDHNIIAQMLTAKTGRYISASYVTQILRRPGSALYAEAIEALRKIIETREQLMNETAL